MHKNNTYQIPLDNPANSGIIVPSLDGGIFMFEQTALGHIQHILKDGETAEFHNGTLFVIGDKDTIRDVYIALCNAYRKRFIQFNHVSDNEYAFDFVLPSNTKE